VTVETHVHRARTVVERERSSVAEKREALGAFAGRIESVETVAANRQPRQAVTGTVGPTSDAGTDRCGTVRTAFEETVGAAVDDRSGLEGIREELGEELALALAPTTPAVLTPGVRDRLRSRIHARRAELSVTAVALDREAESLASAGETVDGVTTWLVDTDETPLGEVAFGGLRGRHDRLEAHRRACERVARQRQSHLDGTTSHDGSVGLDHRALAASLYDGFPVEFPALATVARLVGLLEEAKRAVRDHLVRRI